MDKFEEHEMKKIRPIIGNLFDWLIKQSVVGKIPNIIRDKFKEKKLMIFGDFLILNKEKKNRKKNQNEKRIKDNIIRDFRIHFEQEKEEDYYEPVRVSKFWDNNNIKYESNDVKNRNLSFDEYLNKIESYLRNIIINLHDPDTWKIQLTVAINIISSKDSEEEHVMHSSSDNIKFATYSDANDGIEKLFNSLCSKYEDGLETSRKGSDFIFDFVLHVS